MTRDTQQQVQQARRRLVEATAKPLVDRLQMMTMAKAPQRHELLDALLDASIHPNGVDPVQRVFAAWQRWMLVMHDYEQFSVYARRHIRTRP